MEALLIRQRYKVTQVMRAGENYAALEAVDILDSDQKAFILNVYEGELIKPYLDIYSKLRHCPEYKELFTSDDSLVAVFEQHGGKGIDDVFYKGADIPWEKRLDCAQWLFHKAMTLADQPPELGCAGFLSENLRVQPDTDSFGINFAVHPERGYNKREMLFLLADQIKKVLMESWDSPLEQRAFVRALARGEYTSAVELYSHWLRLRPVLQREYEHIYRKNPISRKLYLLMLNLSSPLVKGREDLEGVSGIDQI
ncbi:MAG: hypothetical protein IJG63_04110 [Oscillospiraceae bacterium]|nr:hypothetical protein [Oscillospiraceae bacterium]